MNRIQPAHGALTSYGSALAALLEGLAPVAPVFLPLSDSLGSIAAEMPALDQARPAHSIAAMDGWALRALEIAGASSYSPVPLVGKPDWVEAGDPLPEGCDCVVVNDLVDCTGPLAQVLGEAIPGQGVRRAGEEVAAGRPVIHAGQRLTAADLLIARSVGLDEVAVRLPRLRVINIAATSGSSVTAQFIAESVRDAGAALSGIESTARDINSIAGALRDGHCDLAVLVGGTGAGRADATAEALKAVGDLIAHNIALQPGRTTALGRIGAVPVVALPGAPDQAFAAWLALVQPVLDRLSGRLARQATILPLARKIASSVGFADIVLLRQDGSAWVPLAIGDLSLDHMRMADAWLAVPEDSEGYAAGAPVAAFPLRSFA